MTSETGDTAAVNLTDKIRFAAVEGGGTSWVAAIAEGVPENIIDRKEFPTLDPETTLTAIKEWLSDRTFDSIGVATFGPVDGKLHSPTYGFITTTPKPGWGNVDVLKGLGVRERGVPFRFDTDVNAPALAEFSVVNSSSSGTKLTSSAYITVGTGVGVGLVCNSSTVHGLVHPEAGHLPVARFPGDSFVGVCPYHGSCIEGLVGTGALASRRGCLAEELPTLPDDDSVWDHCAYYLAQLCASLVLIASPERIVIGGGVMNRSSLYPKIRKYTQEILNGYIQNDMITTDKIEEYIGPSIWGANAGIIGASYLAYLSHKEATEATRP